MKASALVITLTLIAACKSDAGSASKKEAVLTPAIAEAETVPAAAKITATPLPKDKVESAVQVWLSAQNQGDFDAYSASYASRLTGIKRVGSTKKSYNRHGWLEDRQRMFRKKIKVEAADLSVRSNSTSAIVRFVQTWSSGKFKDVGPKQLIVVRENGALKIAREEMLSSAVLSSQRDTSGMLEGLIFAAPEIDGFIVQPAEDAWATGETELDGSEPYMGTRAAALDALPPELRSLKGASITVYGPGGACEDKVAELKVVVGVTPHFGYFQDEEGEYREVSDEELAADLFGMGTAYLVASLAGTCSGGIAQVKGKREVLNLSSVKDGTMSDALYKAFEALPLYKGLQRESDAASGEQDGSPEGSWYDTTDISIFRDEAGNQHLAVVSASGGEGCGDFYGTLTAVFQVDANGKVQLLGTEDTAFNAEHALDLNGDGRIEFQGTLGSPVGDDGGILGIGDGGSYAVLHSFSWDYHDCPC